MWFISEAVHTRPVCAAVTQENSTSSFYGPLPCLRVPEFLLSCHFCWKIQLIIERFRFHFAQLHNARRISQRKRQKIDFKWTTLKLIAVHNCMPLAMCGARETFIQEAKEFAGNEECGMWNASLKFAITENAAFGVMKNMGIYIKETNHMYLQPFQSSHGCAPSTILRNGKSFAIFFF